MIRDLCVYLDGTKKDEERIRAAEQTASLFDAFVAGVYVNTLPDLSPALGYDSGLIDIEDLQSAARASGMETAARLRARLEKLAARSELRHHDIIGAGVAEQFVQEARLFDLCVASRPDPSSSEATHVTEAVMFGSGRSLLLVPPAGGEPFDPKTIVVAWRNTREAARAVAEALPFLSRAETVSLVMVGNEEMGSVERAVQGEDMARHLDRHGVKVELNSVPRGKGVAATLLDEVKLSGAELLVMGAYGHSRLRQWALGGVTREVMSAATVPVLVAH